MSSKKALRAAIPLLPSEGVAEREPDFAEIAEVAYQLWQERGGEHGQDEQDWCRAIEIIRGRNGK